MRADILAFAAKVRWPVRYMKSFPAALPEQAWNPEFTSSNNFLVKLFTNVNGKVLSGLYILQFVYLLIESRQWLDYHFPVAGLVSTGPLACRLNTLFTKLVNFSQIRNEERVI